jgi:hypothetical protein
MFAGLVASALRGSHGRRFLSAIPPPLPPVSYTKAVLAVSGRSILLVVVSSVGRGKGMYFFVKAPMIHPYYTYLRGIL